MKEDIAKNITDKNNFPAGKICHGWIVDGETKIDEDKVKDLVGIPKLAYINKIVNSILKDDVNEALQTIDEVVNEGKDIQNFLWEIIKYVKDILIYKSSKNLSIYSESEIANIEKLANEVTKEKLLQMVYTLSNLENDMKYSSQRLILFEVGIIKLCSGQIAKTGNETSNVDSGEIEKLKSKITQLEMQISKINAGGVIHNISQNVENIPVRKIESTNTQKAKESSTSEQQRTVKNIQIGEKLQEWPKIIRELKDAGKIMLYTNLMNSVASKINDLIIGIQFSKPVTPFGKTILEKSESISELERRVSMECGKAMKIKYIYDDTEVIKKEEQNPIESFAEDNGISFNVIE